MLAIIGKDQCRLFTRALDEFGNGVLGYKDSVVFGGRRVGTSARDRVEIAVEAGRSRSLRGGGSRRSGGPILRRWRAEVYVQEEE